MTWAPLVNVYCTSILYERPLRTAPATCAGPVRVQFAAGEFWALWTPSATVLPVRALTRLSEYVAVLPATSSREPVSARRRMTNRTSLERLPSAPVYVNGPLVQVTTVVAPTPSSEPSCVCW